MMLGYVLGHHDAAPGPSWLGHGVEKLDVAGSGNWATDIHCGEARGSGPLWTMASRYYYHQQSRQRQEGLKDFKITFVCAT